MIDETQEESDLRDRLTALDIWDGEGGAGVFGPQECETRRWRSELREVDTETMVLHARIIALESLAVLLLASAPEKLRQQARDMAISILPRPGRTRHPLTIHAAARMDGIVRRAVRSNDATDAEQPKTSLAPGRT